MPFDNPHELPFGDLEILRAARSRVSDKGSWLKCGFQKGNRFCLLAALSVAAGSRNFDNPNRLERRLARILVAASSDRTTVNPAQGLSCEAAPYAFQRPQTYASRRRAGGV